MDHSILVWDIQSPRAKLAFEAARVFKLHASDSPFPTVTLPPVFSTRDVHSNYIDCVRWFGDFLLSKSCENEIKVWKKSQIFWNLNFFKCWEPDLTKPGEFPSPPIQAMVSFEVFNCPNWYVRFGCDRFQKVIMIYFHYFKVSLFFSTWRWEIRLGKFLFGIWLNIIPSRT